MDWQPDFEGVAYDDENKNLSASELAAVHVKMNVVRSAHTAATIAKGLELDALKKPWRRAGADISDYFNYGFDEESWNAYCKKQTKVRAANTDLCTKIRKRRKGVRTCCCPTQKGHDRHGEGLCCSDSTSGSSSIPASRKSAASSDVTEGRSRSSRRVGAWQSLSDKGGSSQTITEMSPQEDRNTSYHLTPSPNFNSRVSHTHPPSFPYRREPNRRSPSTALDSGHAKKFKGGSTSHYTFPSGISSLTPRTVATKACESYIWQNWCDTERGRSREHGHDKNSTRARKSETESYSSHHREEKRMRHRHSTERGHRPYNFERDSREQEWHRERRRTREGQKTACSSRRSRKEDGEDRKSQNRHKNKKTKNIEKDKETSKMLCPDNEENQI